jgi:transcriptional regulator with XRE-family HTH domain
MLENMSSTKEHEFFSLENVHSSKQLSVTRERETLADYVRRVRQEKGLSLNQVRVHSGYKIANSYISRIENGEVTNVGLEKLSLLAKGLGVVEDEIFAVARGKSVSGDPQLSESKLLEYFRTLSPESQDVLMAYAEMMSVRDSGKGRRIQLDMTAAPATRQREKKRA